MLLPEHFTVLMPMGNMGPAFLVTLRRSTSSTFLGKEGCSVSDAYPENLWHLSSCPGPAGLWWGRRCNSISKRRGSQVSGCLCTVQGYCQEHGQKQQITWADVGSL